MGTVAYNDFLRLALSSAGVVLCLDNDNAGLSAAPKIQRALRLLDVPCKTVYPNAGADPKDMELDWFRNVVESD
jgi:DNA primase